MAITPIPQNIGQVFSSATYYIEFTKANINGIDNNIFHH